MTINWKKLYSALSKHRKALDISWRELAKSHNLTASAFTRLSQGKPLSSANLAKVFLILDICKDFTSYYK